MDFQEARNAINEVDAQLVPLLKKRMSASAAIGEYKKEHQIPILDRERERQILAKVSKEAGEYGKEERILYSNILEISRSIQHRILSPNSKLSEEIKLAIKNTPQAFPQEAVVACQGVEGAYSQVAADKFFPQASIVYFKRFEDVFQAVDRGMCEYGILPIENSSAGSVTEVYDLMKKFKFYIVRSLRLPVHHFLLGKNGVELSNIREIISHQQAISQCSDYLNALKDVKITVCENTAMAAQRVMNSDRMDIAAISSRNCAELYGLKILNDHIQNSDNNHTRFICISRKLEIYPGADKTSLMLSLPHIPGSIYHMLGRFASEGFNLTKLESRPIVGRDFEYLFYLDLDASIYQESLMNVLGQIENELDQFQYLGSYREMV